MSFEGYGSVFGVIDSYNDTIEKGAFAASLAEWRQRQKLPKLLLQHGGGPFGAADDMVPIGKWTEMREDDHGLYIKGRLFNVGTDRVKAVYAALKEGELDGLSIGFNTVNSTTHAETDVRTLTEVRLWEVSLVTFPANDPARVMAVKADGELPSVREFERFLRDAGYSQKTAKAITASGYRSVQRDVAHDGCDVGSVTRLIKALQERTAIFLGE